MARAHALHGTDLRRRLPARHKAAFLGVAKFRTLRKANSGRFRRHQHDRRSARRVKFRLESPRDAVIAGMKPNRPIAEVDLYLVRGKINGGLFVNRRRECSLDFARHHRRWCGASLRRRFPVKPSAPVNLKRNSRRLDHHLAAPQNRIDHTVLIDVQPKFIQSVWRSRLKLPTRIRKCRLGGNRHTNNRERHNFSIHFPVPCLLFSIVTVTLRSIFPIGSTAGTNATVSGALKSSASERPWSLAVSTAPLA